MLMGPALAGGKEERKEKYKMEEERAEGGKGDGEETTRDRYQRE